MDKLKMAHDWAMKHGDPENFKLTIAEAWEYADMMQAKAEKRTVKPDVGTTDVSAWQPYWDLAPDGFDWWAMDSNKHAHFYSVEPFIDNGEFRVFASFLDNTELYISTKTFGYTGAWQDSLRKRPQ